MFYTSREKSYKLLETSLSYFFTCINKYIVKLFVKLIKNILIHGELQIMKLFFLIKSNTIIN